jgi:hypothetical protein
MVDKAASFLISAGIFAFGVWVVASTLTAKSPLAWTLFGILPVLVGFISFFEAVLVAKRGND